MLLFQEGCFPITHNDIFSPKPNLYVAVISVSGLNPPRPVMPQALENQTLLLAGVCGSAINAALLPLVEGAGMPNVGPWTGNQGRAAGNAPATNCKIMRGRGSNNPKFRAPKYPKGKVQSEVIFTASISGSAQISAQHESPKQGPKSRSNNGCILCGINHPGLQGPFVGGRLKGE